MYIKLEKLIAIVNFDLKNWDTPEKETSQHNIKLNLFNKSLIINLYK